MPGLTTRPTEKALGRRRRDDPTYFFAPSARDVTRPEARSLPQLSQNEQPYTPPRSAVVGLVRLGEHDERAEDGLAHRGDEFRHPHGRRVALGRAHRQPEWLA